VLDFIKSVLYFSAARMPQFRKVQVLCRLTFRYALIFAYYEAARAGAGWATDFLHYNFQVTP
jgi:hypothetical protein